MTAHLTEITASEIPPPPLYLDAIGRDGKPHQCLVEAGSKVPSWFEEKETARVAAPNGVQRTGHANAADVSKNFYEACSAILGAMAKWLPEPSKPIPEYGYSVWFDDVRTPTDHGELVGKLVRFRVPKSVNHAFLEICNDGGPNLFAPIDSNMLLYVDVLKGKSGRFLCPRILTNFTLPAAFWGFRRARLSSAAELAATEIVGRIKGQSGIDWAVAAAHGLLLYPRLSKESTHSVIKSLEGVESESSDAAICLALIQMIYGGKDRKEALKAAREAIIRISTDAPRFGCTLELLGAKIDVLAELLRHDDENDPALDSIRLLAERISASYGRGDVNVFRGKSPSEPDSTALGASGSKKNSDLIDRHFASRGIVLQESPLVPDKVEQAAASGAVEPSAEKIGRPEAAKTVEKKAPPAAAAAKAASPKQEPRQRIAGGGGQRDIPSRSPHGRDRRSERDSEFVDKLVHINRVAKVVKGGKRFGFAALVVMGDQKGRVGFGHGKAREVPEAIRKATESAKRNLTRVALREGRTLHHDVAGRHGAGRVYLRAAPAGTGIIAGGPMRAVFETLGIQDVVAKSIGSSNPYNMVRATFDALKHQESPRSVAARRGIKVSRLQDQRATLGSGGSAVDYVEEAVVVSYEAEDAPQHQQHHRYNAVH